MSVNLKKELDKIKSHVDTILQKRILRKNKESKSNFPKALQGETVFYNIAVSDKFLVLFFSKDHNENNNNFPGLITFNDKDRVAFSYPDNSKNNYLENCEAHNLYSLKLGIDCTVILSNHRQVLNTKDQNFDYIIDFAYILTFGNEIKIENVSDFIDDLVIYSVSIWSKSHVK